MLAYVVGKARTDEHRVRLGSELYRFGGKLTGVLNFIGRVSALSVIMRKSTLFIYFDVAFREEIFHAFKQKCLATLRIYANFAHRCEAYSEK